MRASSRSRALNCPGCGTGVAEDVSICPRCDYIIDDSFLATPAPARPPSPNRRPGTGRTAPSASPQASSRRLDDEPASAAEPLPPRPTGIVPPEQVLEELWGSFRALEGPDQLTVAGAALTLLFSFMPWKETAAEGELIGLLSIGVWAVLGALTCVVGVALRTASSAPRLSALWAWGIQLGASAFTVLFCLVFMKLSFDSREMTALDGHFAVATSRPSFGVFLGFCSALLSVVGTVMGLRGRSAHPSARARRPRP